MNVLCKVHNVSRTPEDNNNSQITSPSLKLIKPAVLSEISPRKGSKSKLLSQAGVITSNNIIALPFLLF